MPDELTNDVPAEPRSWPYSEMETFYAHELPSYRERCEVIFRGPTITVSHTDPALGLVVLTGREVEDGHFTLHAPNGASLTLHRFARGDRLEGSWVDRGNNGMLTVTLSDDPEDG